MILDDNLSGSVATKEESKSRIKLWYDGYIIGDQTLYNPWSIMQCLNYQKLDNYWLKTGDDIMLREALKLAANNANVNFMLQELFNGKIIDVSVYYAYRSRDLNNSSLIWHLALHSGYLTAKRYGLSYIYFYDFELMIPNFEVKSNFKSLFIE